jgi:plastocyanin
MAFMQLVKCSEDHHFFHAKTVLSKSYLNLTEHLRVMDYFEVHISKGNFERIIFIGSILILIIIAIFAYHKKPGECPQVECEYVNETPAVEPAVQENLQIENETAQEDHKISYVDIENLRFAPKELIIRNDTTVVFRNKEKATAHKVYEAHGLFLGPRMLPGDSFNYTFTDFGNYTLYSVVGKDKGTRMTIEVIP